MASGDESPAPSTPHTYLRITPSAEPLPAARVTDQFEQLHTALGDTAIEVCLTTDGDELAYYLGTTPDCRDLLRRVVSRLFPDSYAFTPTDTDPLAPIDPTTVAELHGVGDRREDWQTRLRPPSISDAPEQHDTARVEDAPGLPLGSIAAALRTTDGPAAYQALLTPKPDWSGQAEYRVEQLEHERDTLGQRLAGLVLPSEDAFNDSDRHSPRRAANRRGDAGSVPGTRVDGILAKATHNCYRVNARLLASGPDADTVVDDLAATFTGISGDFYAIEGVVHEELSPRLQTAITDRTPRSPIATRRLLAYLPVTANRSPEIIADSTTVAHFCLLDGSTLTEPVRRALQALPGERTGLTPPSPEQLATYETGLPIGHPQRRDGQTVETTVALPPTLQRLHLAWFGKTGSGKSTALVRGITANHEATAGADICILPKGDAMATTLLRTHYAKHGSLDDVYYFDCTETLPAIPFFDIRDALAAGVSRTTAVQDVTDHYIELLRAIMGREQFERAVRSPDVIRYLIKALFDPEYGADAFTHRELEQAVHTFRREQTPPLVSDPDLREMLAGVAANDADAFAHIMQGVANRIEKVPVDDRLARLFNLDPDETQFELADILDENALVIIDTGGLRATSQRSLALVVLSQLWTALRERHQRREDAPLVNLYLEEAADLAVSTLLSELLAQSRAFDLAVTLAMQFPGQLQETAPEAYAELMNNVSTIVAGNVALDTQLQRRLATDDMPPDAVGNRLRALSRGEWLLALPAPFNEPEPRPFVVESLPLPTGHPDGPDLSEPRAAAFRAESEACATRTAETAGVTMTDEATRTTQSSATAGRQVDSALPTTDRLPAAVRYDADAHAIVCTACDARYAPTVAGIERGCQCCHDTTPPRDAIPICDVPLTLSTRERQAAEWTHEQLLFLQAVYAAQHQRFDSRAYALARDSMVRLRDDCGLTNDDVDALCEAGLLRRDGTTPHMLYTVTTEGRTLLQEPHREGDTHGHEAGDVAESSLHALMVQLGARHLEATFGDDPDSAVVRVVRYYDRPDADGRFDAVGLADDDEIIVTLEAERPHNDRFEAVPADYDKLAAPDPDAALWVTPTRSGAQEVLTALNDPADGSPRVTKDYSENSPPSRWRIDEPGFTGLYTVTQLQREYVDAES